MPPPPGRRDRRPGLRLSLHDPNRNGTCERGRLEEGGGHKPRHVSHTRVVSLPGRARTWAEPSPTRLPARNAGREALLSARGLRPPALWTEPGRCAPSSSRLPRRPERTSPRLVKEGSRERRFTPDTLPSTNYLAVGSLRRAGEEALGFSRRGKRRRLASSLPPVCWGREVKCGGGRLPCEGFWGCPRLASPASPVAYGPFGGETKKE